RLVAPHALHAWHAGSLQLLPDRASARRAAVEGVVVGRNARHGTGQHRVITVPERLHADCRALLHAAGVVAGPFTEGAFHDEIAFVDEALECDLGFRRNGQARLRSLDDADRLADEAACGIVLVLAVRNLDAGHRPQARMHADDHSDRARLAAFVVLLHQD